MPGDSLISTFARLCLPLLVGGLAIVGCSAAARAEPVTPQSDVRLEECSGHAGDLGLVTAISTQLDLKLADGSAIRPAMMLWWEGRTDLRAWLAGQLVGEQIDIYPASNHIGTDRYGRIVAHVVRRRDRNWLQMQVLSNGNARLQPTAQARFCSDQLFGTENAARSSGMGLWADPQNRLQMAGDSSLFKLAGSVQIVEGVVHSVGMTSRNVFLNFGADWLVDFTAQMSLNKRQRKTAGQLRQKPSVKLDPANLSGKTVRLRGWIESSNGALMRIEVNEQIEIVDDRQAESQ